MRQDEGYSSVWRSYGTKWRTFTRIWLLFTVIWLFAVFFIGDAHWGTRVSAVINVVVGLGVMVTARTGSSANQQGIEITQYSTRRIPWTNVADLTPDAAGRWSNSVQARLIDGSTVILLAVPVADLPRLEELQGAKAGGPEPGDRPERSAP